MARTIFLSLLSLGVFTELFSTMSRGDEPRTIRGNDDMARVFIDEHEKWIRPLEYQANLAWWNANVSGKDEDFKAKEQAQNKLDAALSDKARFERLKSINDHPLREPVLAREIAVLYLVYLEKQLDPNLLERMTAKANAIEQAFNGYRAVVNGKSITDSEVRRVLKDSRDVTHRKAVWEGSKGVGKVVEADLKALVALRNEAATKLGFKDYHAMQLSLNEQKQEEVLALFDELDELTRGPFHELKKEVDQKIAEQLSIGPDELRPWHFHDPFFQEPPAIYPADFDSVYAKADILDLCRKFYAGIGLPIEDVIARSDLYEKPGKSPHAFCTDINREGDVRVLANIVPNEYWMGTMLHELGHAVYSSRNIPRSVPYVLRGEAHILTTEGIAMLFERFSKDADWLQAMGVPVSEPKAFDESGARMQRAKLLVFSRWAQVMFRFEKALYANPNQDLNALWWDLVERYQEVKRPEGRSEPDYASKIHIVSAPAYYHNYLMGQLFADQVLHAIARDVLDGITPSKASFVGKPAVGEYLKKRVFAPGRSLNWNELTRHATGAPLNARAFAAEISGH